MKILQVLLKRIFYFGGKPRRESSHPFEYKTKIASPSARSFKSHTTEAPTQRKNKYDDEHYQEESI